MKKVSNEFINLSNKIKTQDLKLIINDGELTVQEVIAKELKYSFEGQLFKTIMQQIEITVKSASEIKGKKVDFQYGILVNNEFEYLDMGEYYIKDVEDDKNKEELVVTGYDKMLNFMIPFKQSDLQLTYPCDMGQLVKRMGEICGVELYSTDFYNSNLVVDEDFFTVQELTYRDVLEKIAQATLTTIFIKEDKLYLCKIGESVQTLDTSFLSNLVIGEKFGPVNALVLGRGSVEDNIESVDQESIDSNGRCEIRFDENEFVDTKRKEVINGMFQQIKDLEYYVIEASNLGVLWLEPCDVIIVKDREESEYKTIYLKASVTINTGIKGEMEADVPEVTTTEYKVTTEEKKKVLKVERLAKKNEGLIQDLIEQNTEHETKLTQVTQDIDGIKQNVSDIADFTREKEQIENLYLDNVATGQGYILSLVIYGNTELFNSNEITVTASTKPRDYGESLYIATENNEEILTESEQQIIVGSRVFAIDYIKLILDDVLRSLTVDEQTYYDTLEIAQDGTITITRRIGIDENGELYLLDKEEVKVLEDTFILPSEEEVYYFIEELDRLRYYAKYIMKNNYSDYFATKVELDTLVTQTAEEFSVQISKKVDEDEIISKINLSSEQITLSGNRLVVNSTNFKLDKEGNVTLVGIIRDDSGNILVSKDRILTNLTFDASGFLGMLGGHYGAPYLKYLIINAQIPENFEIKSANISIQHQPITWSCYNSSGEKTNVEGYARDIQIYVNTRSALESLESESDWSEISQMSELGGMATIALGKYGKTFSATEIENVTSDDLSNYLNSSQMIQFAIGTTDNASLYTVETDTYGRCGRSTAQLHIIGYLKP